MTTPNVPQPQGVPAGQARPKPLRIVKGPDGKPRVVRRGLAALHALQANIPKVLRIGVIQGARIVEERIVRLRETVNIGPNEKNHFVVSAASLPAKHPLFELREGAKAGEQQYFLTILDGMTGRVAFPADQGGVMDFNALKASGRAQRTPKGLQVPLTDQCRGKVVVGDTTLLFQFVVPPPIQPRPQLPASVKGGWISRMELGMMLCLGFSVVAHVGIMVATMVPDWPKPTLDEILSSEWAQIPVPQPEAVDTEEDTTGDETKAEEGEGQASDQAAQDGAAEATTEVAVEQPGPRQTGPRTPTPGVMVDGRRVSEAAYNAQQAGVRNALSMENILGGGDSGLGISSAFSGDSGTVGNLQASINGLAGTQDGGQSGSGYTTMAGNLSGGPAVGELGQGADGNQQVVVPGHDQAVDTGPPQKIITGTVRRGGTQKAGGTGLMNRDVFMGAFNRKIRGIEQCYNNALPRDPTLEGDLTFLITINMQGGVSVSVEQDAPALRAAGVTDCIERKLTSMNFASNPPQGGDFKVRQSFSFIPP